MAWRQARECQCVSVGGADGNAFADRLNHEWEDNGRNRTTVKDNGRNRRTGDNGKGHRGNRTTVDNWIGQRNRTTE